MNQETQIKRADCQVSDLKKILTQTQRLMEKNSSRDWEESFVKVVGVALVTEKQLLIHGSILCIVARFIIVLWWAQDLVGHLLGNPFRTQERTLKIWIKKTKGSGNLCVSQEWGQVGYLGPRMSFLSPEVSLQGEGGLFHSFLGSLILYILSGY